MPQVLLLSAIPVGLAALLWFCSAAGARFAKRVKVRNEDMLSIGVVQGALLGLMALLLGFSYSGAMTRFAARQDLLLHETNAIGTAWLRADMLPAEQRHSMRDALRRYVQARSALFQSPASAVAEHAPRIDAAFKDAWAIATDAARTQPHLSMVLLPPLNEAADALAAQRASHARHIPTLILIVLLACACGSVAAVGFGLVNVDRRTHLPAIVLVALITGALWLIIDMDYPKLGLIRVSGQPLIDLREAMVDTPPVSATPRSPAAP